MITQKLGNSIELTINLLTDGEAININEANIDVYTRCNRYHKHLDFTLEGTLLSIVFEGKDQRVAGNYTVEIYQNKGTLEQKYVEIVDAFRLIRDTNVYTSTGEYEATLLSSNQELKNYVNTQIAGITEEDTVFRSSPAYTITEADKQRWNDKLDAVPPIYATKDWSNNRFLTQHQDLSSYATHQYVTATVEAMTAGLENYDDAELRGRIAGLESNVLTKSNIVDDLGDLSSDKPISARAVNEDMVNYVDQSITDTMLYINQQDNSEHAGRVAGDNLLSYRISDLENAGYLTSNELSSMGYISVADVVQMGYITEHQDLSSYALRSELPDLSEYATKDELPDTSNFITAGDVAQMGYITSYTDTIYDDTDLQSRVASLEAIDHSQYLTEHQDLSYYALKTELPDLSAYATKSEMSAYLPLSGGTISGDIVPDYISARNLGSNIVPFKYVYTNVIGNSISGNFLEMVIQNQPGFKFGRDLFIPMNGQDLGADYLKWGAAYITTIYENGAALADKYALKTELPDTSNFITSEDLPDTSDFITMSDVEEKGYLTEHQDISGLATKDEVEENNTALFQIMDQKIAMIQIPEGGSDYDDTDLQDRVGALEAIDHSQYITEHQDISGLATKDELSAYLPLNGGTISGTTYLSNNTKLFIGTERPWYLFENGTGGSAKCVFKSNNNKSFIIQDSNGNAVMTVNMGNKWVEFNQSKPVFNGSYLVTENDLNSALGDINTILESL